MRVSKGKCKALHLGENKPMKQYGLGTACLENRFEEKDQGVPGREVEHETWQPGRPATSWAALPKGRSYHSLQLPHERQQKKKKKMEMDASQKYIAIGQDRMHVSCSMGNSS